MREMPIVHIAPFRPKLSTDQDVQLLMPHHDNMSAFPILPMALNRGPGEPALSHRVVSSPAPPSVPHRFHLAPCEHSILCRHDRQTSHDVSHIFIQHHNIIRLHFIRIQLRDIAIFVWLKHCVNAGGSSHP